MTMAGAKKAATAAKPQGARARDAEKARAAAEAVAREQTRVEFEARQATREANREAYAGEGVPTLGAKVNELIEARGLSMARAAAMTGMTRQQLFRIIHGDIPNPGILTVQALVLALGGRMKDLFADGNLMPAPPRKVEKKV